MTTVYTSPVDIMLYHPEPDISEPYPIGEFRGRKQVSGDLSGGYIGVQFVPTNLEQGRQFVWLWMVGCIFQDQLTAINNAYQEILRLETGEVGGMTFITSSVLIESTNYPWKFGGFSKTLNLNRIRIPHRPDGSVLTGNSFNCDISSNINGAAYIASVWGFIYHPEVRTRAGGFRFSYPA